ncbi:MAG: hypothetical protein ACOX5J_00525 [Candidatus Hydrogenedentales bacterium]|jgi:hypothetical protein
MTQQTKWRIVGGIAIAGSVVLAYGGLHWNFPRQSLTHFMVYWLVFFIFFVTALLLAIWDLRYIRAQYRVDERELFRQTLGEEDFRKRLREAEQQARKQSRNR